jgi:hypothetical protein
VQVVKGILENNPSDFYFSRLISGKAKQIVVDGKPANADLLRRAVSILEKSGLFKETPTQRGGVKYILRKGLRNGLDRASVLKILGLLQVSFLKIKVSVFTSGVDFFEADCDA